MFLVAIIMQLLANISLGYDDANTHPQITTQATAYSKLNSVVKNNLGFTDGVNKILKNINTNEAYPISKWLWRGSKLEDHPMCRASNHFHNPLLEWDQSQLNDSSGFTGWAIHTWCVSHGWLDQDRKSALTWATGLLSPDAQPIPRVNQQMGWDNARTYFYAALTSTANIDREENFAKTFLAVGQVMHLLQDMAVPAHVRNDFLNSHVYNGGANPYELYVKLNQNLVSGLTDAQIITPAFTYPRPTDFWDAKLMPGVVTNVSLQDKAGLAEYTNANFVSEGTLISDSSNTFPYPALSSVQTTTVDIPDPFVNGWTIPRTYYKKINDWDTGYLLAGTGFLDVYQASPLGEAVPPIPPLDKYVHNDYANHLLPRAVGYSAGLLNYFFRGELGVTFIPGGLKIKNQSAETMSNYVDAATGTIGTISVYYDNNTSGERKSVADYNLSSPLDPGQEVLISFPTPTDNATPNRYIIVFRGKLGNEEGAVVGLVHTPKPIYYTSARNGTEKIYKMGGDGSNPTVIYDNQDPNIYVRKPTPSPDGKTLAFVMYGSLSDQIGSIYLLNLTTGQTTRLTSGDSISWSPDGSKIVFQRETGSCLPSFSDYEIFTINVASQTETQLTNVPGCSGSTQPAYSPNGSRIAYSRYEPVERGENCWNFDVIYLMDASGTPIGPVTCSGTGVEDFGPAWSPDGAEIAFLRRFPTQNYYQLYKVNATTGATTKLTDSDGTGYNESFSAWPSDGGSIAVGSQRDGDYDIWLVDPNGGGYLANLTNANLEADIQPEFER